MISLLWLCGHLIQNSYISIWFQTSKSMKTETTSSLGDIITKFYFTFLSCCYTIWRASKSLLCGSYATDKQQWNVMQATILKWVCKIISYVLINYDVFDGFTCLRSQAVNITCSSDICITSNSTSLTITPPGCSWIWSWLIGPLVMNSFLIYFLGQRRLAYVRGE